MPDGLHIVKIRRGGRRDARAVPPSDAPGRTPCDRLRETGARPSWAFMLESPQSLSLSEQVDKQQHDSHDGDRHDWRDSYPEEDGSRRDGRAIGTDREPPKPARVPGVLRVDRRPASSQARRSELGTPACAVVVGMVVLLRHAHAPCASVCDPSWPSMIRAGVAITACHRYRWREASCSGLRATCRANTMHTCRLPLCQKSCGGALSAAVTQRRFQTATEGPVVSLAVCQP
jgi:hypothetical protein